MKDGIQATTAVKEVMARAAAEAAVQSESAQYNTLSIRTPLALLLRQPSRRMPSFTASAQLFASRLGSERGCTRPVRTTSAWRICAELILATTKHVSKRPRAAYSRTCTAGSSNTQTSNVGAMTRRAGCCGQGQDDAALWNHRRAAEVNGPDWPFVLFILPGHRLAH
ncbi:hypothetical protein GMDG_01916 [Pseudogymnoascus destructans 20631-21]|uniref:Uncharacterized protein n=1 Tax=Pseudogymnoascus destructans (strain ATCC MYA-4855 / 20631-21) TaxID=658429 RepID=L8FZK2_PSED2|nr:hypothetical protein GMDG_01916 [Pseudogymnoascus destructans 20631-21]